MATKLQTKMDAPSYQERVPDKVKADDAAKVARYGAEIAENEKQLAVLGTFA